MKKLNCGATIARAIRKFGLRDVQAAVEMAVELSDIASNEIQKPRQRKSKLGSYRSVLQPAGIDPATYTKTADSTN